MNPAAAPVKAKAKAKAPVKVEKAAAVVKVKAVKPPKVKLEPYTVFYKESRKKFMAVNGQGKTEAARKTVEAALAFLKNKYNVTGKVL
jgi:hypothetical protein